MTEMINHIVTMKADLNRFDNLIERAREIIHRYEQRIFDMQDKEHSRKYGMVDNKECFKEAASRTYH